MAWWDDALDWAADKVQSATGEKERRQLVEKIKILYEETKQKIKAEIQTINLYTRQFNDKIRDLNRLRKKKVEYNITRLFEFLGKFGQVKSMGEYVKEDEKPVMFLPEQKFEKIEDYIAEVDWSKDDVFINTFFRSPIGMAIRTKEQNLSMVEELRRMELDAEATIAQLKHKRLVVENDKEICDIYIYCIHYISDYITNIILPELELVESFFQALKIKNEVIAERVLCDLVFSNDLQLLQDTVYKKHFLFVKNTFMFYVLSCKIYNSPILSRIINNESSQEDKCELKKQTDTLLEQGKLLKDSLVIGRGR